LEAYAEAPPASPSLPNTMKTILLLKKRRRRHLHFGTPYFYLFSYNETISRKTCVRSFKEAESFSTFSFKEIYALLQLPLVRAKRQHYNKGGKQFMSSH
jgi:hypothetical protein